MLSGSLTRNILLFALPLAASNILQQFFNAVDVAVIGNFGTAQGMAAVGSNSSVINLLVNLFSGVSIGANVVISTYVGQRSESGIRNAVHTAACFALFSGFFLLVVGLLASRPILEIIDTPEDVIDLSTLYLDIYFMGMPFILAFNFGAAILRSVGDTRRPLVCLAVAGVLNAVLDMIFVCGFDMGVGGVALATVIANAVAASMVVYFLVKEKGAVRLEPRHMRVSGGELSKMLKIGLPAGLQGVVFSFSNVAIQGAINSFGSEAMAGSAAALFYEQLCYFVMASFNGAATTFVGQNYGAGQHERCRAVMKRCMLLAVLVCGAMNVLIAWQAPFFVTFFTDNEVAMDYAETRMHVALAVQFIACSYEISGSVLRGLGNSLLPALLTVFGTCVLRLLWVFVVFPVYGSYEALVAVYPASWAVTGVLVFGAYLVYSRRVLR